MAFIISSLEEDKHSFKYWLLSLPGRSSRRLTWIWTLRISLFMPFWRLILSFFHLWLSICSIIFLYLVRIILNTWCLWFLLILIALLLLLLFLLLLLLLFFLFLLLLFRRLLLFWFFFIFLLLFGVWFFLVRLVFDIILFIWLLFIRANTFISNYLLFLLLKSFATLFFPLILCNIFNYFLLDCCHLLD